jgi:hypothetical protein
VPIVPRRPRRRTIQLHPERPNRDEPVRSEDVRKGLVVFVRCQEVWSAYEKLGTEKSFGADPNLWQNAFELVRNFKPKVGTENTVDVVLATPNGPRPRGPRSSWFPASHRASSSINPRSLRRATSRSAWMPCTASGRRSGKPPSGFFQRGARK